ncbi:PF13274 family protein [Leptospira weilii serovar Ranarum str. ICFT]|uniref:PF13274 family protein n=1 Tax=Leptospira weilii serovar Ranarum str. ICFT TaxID=1218598 RepID=N1WAX5_9LEPT|nr:type II toxin-antitoxin system antitoxin SocA domain-containing protein [Leptospira weilii]EMY76085.1 PF13274 family protein [Leptospira weilii serovar Ranarum str. ICFT]
MRHKITFNSMSDLIGDSAKIALLVSHSPDGRILVTHLVKMLYALELKSLAEKEKRITNIRFIHDHYGPNVPEIELILNNDKLFKIETENGKTFYSVKKSLKELETQISSKDVQLISSFAKEFYLYKFSDKEDPHNAGGLLGYAYNTLPFIETKFKEEILFERYTSTPLIDKVLIKDKDFLRYQKQSNKLSEDISPLFTQAGRERLRARLRH